MGPLMGDGGPEMISPWGLGVKACGMRGELSSLTSDVPALQRPSKSPGERLYNQARISLCCLDSKQR